MYMFCCGLAWPDRIIIADNLHAKAGIILPFPPSASITTIIIDESAPIAIDFVCIDIDSSIYSIFAIFVLTSFTFAMEMEMMVRQLHDIAYLVCAVRDQ